MSQKKICLASDNWTSSPSLILKAVVEANEDFSPSYGADPWTEEAQKIASIIQDIPNLSLSHPVQTNQIFFTAPPSWIPLIQEKIFCYLWDQSKNEIRFITSWNTSEEDVEKIRLILVEISHLTPN